MHIIEDIIILCLEFVFFPLSEIQELDYRAINHLTIQISLIPDGGHIVYQPPCCVSIRLNSPMYQEIFAAFGYRSEPK